MSLVQKIIQLSLLCLIHFLLHGAPEASAAAKGHSPSAMKERGLSAPSDLPSSIFDNSLSFSLHYAEGIQKRLDEIKAELDQIETSLQQSVAEPAVLAHLRTSLSVPSHKAQVIITEVSPRLQEHSEHLRHLGEAPKDNDATENEQITKKRKLQEEIIANYRSLEKQARIHLVRAEQLDGRIALMRWSLFKERIFERQIGGILNLQLWHDAFLSIPILAKRGSFLFADWKATLEENIQAANIIIFLLGLTLIIPFYIALQRFLSRPLQIALSDKCISSPAISDFRRNLLAFWTCSVKTLLPSIACLMIYFLLKVLGFLSPKASEFLFLTFVGLCFYALIRGLSLSLLQPSYPQWRLISVDNRSAKILYWIIQCISATYFIGQTLNHFNELIFAPLPLRIIKEIILSGLIFVLLTTALLITLKESQKREKPLVRWHWYGMFPLVWLGNILIIIAILFGFSSLAGLIASQIVVAGAILTYLKIFLNVLGFLLLQTVNNRSSFLLSITDQAHVPAAAVTQIGILADALIRIALICSTLLFLSSNWGIEPGDIFNWLRTSFFGSGVSDSSFTFMTAFLGISLSVIIILITRSIRNWLENAYLPHTSLDIGIRNSIRTAFGYFGYLMAFMAGLSYMGLDLSNIAIVAGALSVGIGFGLQSIVNNFVSGLILLAERPIKAGDWIVVDGAEGYVRKISVRATEVETFHGASVIIPNSTLISSPVTNLTHNDRHGRISIDVDVAYGNDPEKVREVILQVANRNPHVLIFPAPSVLLMNFGDYSLKFQLRAFLVHIDDGIAVSSAIRFAIIRALRENDIEIPFPRYQIDLAPPLAPYAEVSKSSGLDQPSTS